MRGMFRLVLLAAAVLSAVASCSDGRGEDPAEVAGRTACLYYENLLHGRFAEYVDGFYRPDSIPDGYRAQLIDNARMFMAQQNDEHHGIKSVSLGRATADTVRNVAASVGIDVNSVDYWRSALDVVRGEINEFLTLSEKKC